MTSASKKKPRLFVSSETSTNDTMCYVGDPSDFEQMVKSLQHFLDIDHGPASGFKVWVEYMTDTQIRELPEYS